MPLTSGTRIGPYEIQSPIGVGGMGEVYRATDVSLGRSVAIKVLPEAFVHDVDRHARFEREAKTLAALNHPNIAHLYGLETSTGMHALVMELVEGATLGERIAKGAIPFAEAIRIALQIAEALQAAHEQGIIHRDLKPANVKVRDDGTVKVLDFGLAKALEPAGSTSNLSQSPTITTPAMTQAGAVLGTAAYMSPEQAKGRAADKRSDVWSFGCVLFEMLTGKRTFDGEDVADTLAAVLRADPDWDALPPETPPPIVTLLQRCLEKDRRGRIADIAAAQFVLTEHAAYTSRNGSIGLANQKTSLRLLLFGAALLLTAIFAGAAVWFLKPAGKTASTPVRFNVSFPEAQQFNQSGVRQVVAISPDGTQIVYVASGRLYRRAIDELESHAIAGSDFDGFISHPVFSPDGRWIVFHTTSDSTLKRMPLAGGSATTIAEIASPSGVSWSDRGILFGQFGGIFQVSPNGGKTQQLVHVEADQAVFGPQLLPGGDAILYTLAPGFGPDRWDRAQIVVQSLKSGERKTLIDGGSDGRYLPTGHLVYTLSGTVFGVAFNPATGAIHGERIPILPGVMRSVGFILGTTQFAVSETGSLVYIPGPANATATQRSLVVYDDSGAMTPLKLPSRNYLHPRVSRDGTRLAVAIDDAEEAHIWIYDLTGKSAIQRLTLEGRNAYPVWSPDGQRVAFQSERQGDRGIFWQRTDGGGAAERLTTAPKDSDHIPESFSPDGKHLLFTERRGSSYQLDDLSMDNKKTTLFGNVKSAEAPGAVFSPDGHWIAYAVSDRTGGGVVPGRGIFIQPFPATGAVYAAPKTRIDYHPAWAPDGKRLYYVPSSNQPYVAVSVKTQPSVTFGSPALLSQSVPRPSLLSTEMRGYDLLPDGRFVSVVPAFDQNSTGTAFRPELRVVLNWYEELKRLVPTR